MGISTCLSSRVPNVISCPTESTLVDEWGLSVVKTPAGSYVTTGYVAMPDGEKDTIVPLVHEKGLYFIDAFLGPPTDAVKHECYVTHLVDRRALLWAAVCTGRRARLRTHVVLRLISRKSRRRCASNSAPTSQSNWRTNADAALPRGRRPTSALLSRANASCATAPALLRKHALSQAVLSSSAPSASTRRVDGRSQPRSTPSKRGWTSSARWCSTARSTATSCSLCVSTERRSSALTSFANGWNVSSASPSSSRHGTITKASASLKCSTTAVSAWPKLSAAERASPLATCSRRAGTPNSSSTVVRNADAARLASRSSREPCLTCTLARRTSSALGARSLTRNSRAGRRAREAAPAKVR